jgi:hypothetical protein
MSYLPIATQNLSAIYTQLQISEHRGCNFLRVFDDVPKYTKESKV